MKNYEERTDAIFKKMNSKKRIRKRIITSTALTLCGAFIIGLNLTLFLPLSYENEIEKYTDSEYYPLIEQMYEISPKPTQYKNNYEKLKDGLSSLKWGGFQATEPAVQPDGSFSDTTASGSETYTPDNTDSYEEVTDNQVNGVTEGDLFKRTKDKLFYLQFNNYNSTTLLKVYSIKGEQSEELCSYNVFDNDFEKITPNSYTPSASEMFLSDDGNMVTVVTSCKVTNSSNYYNIETAIINIDVSDLNNITQLPVVYMSGKYVSSRIVDGDLYVVSTVNYYSAVGYDFGDELTYVPQVGTTDDKEILPMDKITLPSCPTNFSMTILCKYDYASQSVADDMALFSYSSDVYVSTDSIYAINSASTTNGSTSTEIARIKFDGDKLEHTNTYTVNGSINDRYSLDEKDGVLRLFSTTTGTFSSDNAYGLSSYTYTASSASFYCIDIQSGDEIAKVENFAPEGETVRSARFNGNSAYVCTAVLNTDPVFVFDLTNYSNITYTDSGTIPGFSTSLAMFKDGTLIGFGESDGRYSKIEVYDGTTAQVIATYQLDEENIGLSSSEISSEYKAYYINKEEGYIGLAVFGIQYDSPRLHYTYSLSYILLKFDGESFECVLNEQISNIDPTAYYENYYAYSTTPDGVRATLIDDCFYILTLSGLTTTTI